MATRKNQAMGYRVRGLAWLGVLVFVAGCSKAQSHETGDEPETTSPIESNPSRGQESSLTEKGVARGVTNVPDQEHISKNFDSAINEAKSGDKVVGFTANGGTRVAVLGHDTLADTEWYQVRIETQENGPINKKQKSVVHIEPKKGWKLNAGQGFPTRFKVTAPPGVSVDNMEQKEADAAEFTAAKAAFHVDFVGRDVGKKAFAAEVSFGVCTDETCIMKKEKLAWAVTLK